MKRPWAPRRRGRRSPPRPAPPRVGGVELAYGLSLVMVVATILLLGMAFWRLVHWAPRPSDLVVRTHGPAPAGRASGTPGKVWTVLRLRDLVGGMVWLSTQPDAGLSAAQRQRLAPLLGAVRRNLEGPPQLVDAPLEQKVQAVLTAAQVARLTAWVHAGGHDDYLACLQKLEAAAGVAAPGGARAPR